MGGDDAGVKFGVRFGANEVVVGNALLTWSFLVQSHQSMLHVGGADQWIAAIWPWL